MKPLHVVTAISNSPRYRARAANYKVFEKRALDAGAILWTAEAAFGDRPFEVTTPQNPQHIQVRTFDEIWHKEALLNLAISRLPEDWEYVAWVDSDVLFTRPDWVEETVHQLQHYMWIQMFSHCQDVGPDYRLIADKHGGESLPSFMHQYVKHGRTTWGDWQSYYSKYQGHTGYAWAARREALEETGGLIDRALLGSADHHMARGLVGDVMNSINPNMTESFKHFMLEWQDRAKALKMDVGYMPGLITHHWHGRKKQRGYLDRWKILVNNKYNPYEDIKLNPNGIYALKGNKPRMRDQIRQYFTLRNEDSIDVS